ncbi:Photosystem II reaction centre X protein (PsbX) [Synechococcus sp. PCC 7502]|nr:photosystem II reaction center X protein [Synechococcus sp. PCC 7502]AFY74322.1 Photosystem II reaction centre X protein (PsbX) [Synechococcus sp. PCC 7502]
MTPSLINFFWGLGYGATFVIIAVTALVLVSQKDKVKRQG